MRENPKTKLPKMPPDVGFSLGFFCGALLSAVGVYMLVTPEGKELKAALKAEFERQHRSVNLERLVLEQSDAPSDIPFIASIHRLIKRARTVLAPVPVKNAPKPVNQTHPVAGKKHFFKQK